MKKERGKIVQKNGEEDGFGGQKLRRMVKATVFRLKKGRLRETW